MSSLSTLPKGDSAWLLRKAIERIMQQVSVLETNIGSSTTGNSANQQVIFNDNGTLRGDAAFVFDATTDMLTVTGFKTFGTTQLSNIGILYVGTIGTPKLKVDVAGTGITTITQADITGDLTVDTSTLKVDSTLNKVGIGVATLTGLSTLNVAGDVGITSDLVLKNGAGTAQGFIFGSSGLNYRVIASNPHVWQEGGTDLMRLNSTGLGVGVAPSTGYKLSSGRTTGGAQLAVTTGLAAGSVISPLNIDLDFLGVADNVRARIRSTDTSTVTNNGVLEFWTTLANVASKNMTLDASGNLSLANGNVVMATPGKGIDFTATASGSGTMTSELLNDYEEGTWTGTLNGGTTNPTIPVTATGKYTKIGRQVTVVIYFSNVNTTGASGSVDVTGLPFTEDGTRAVGTAAFYNFDFNGGTGPFVDVSVTTMFFQTQLTNSNWRDINHTAGVGRYLRATLTYFV